MFLTTSEEHLRQGYSMNPCHYLIKPANDEDFLRAMENCRMKPPYAVPFLEVTTYKVSHSIDTALIAYIDFYRRSTLVHLTNHVLSVSGSFAAVTEPLLALVLCISFGGLYRLGAVRADVNGQWAAYWHVR